MPYIYLLHCRASIDANEPVYKIGKSDKDDGTAECFNGYTDGSVPLFSIHVADEEKFENDIKAIFGLRFKPRTDYGSEYFEGNAVEMINLIWQYYITETNRTQG